MLFSSFLQTLVHFGSIGFIGRGKQTEWITGSSRRRAAVQHSVCHRMPTATTMWCSADACRVLLRAAGIAKRAAMRRDGFGSGSINSVWQHAYKYAACSCQPGTDRTSPVYSNASSTFAAVFRAVGPNNRSCQFIAALFRHSWRRERFDSVHTLCCERKRSAAVVTAGVQIILH